VIAAYLTHYHDRPRGRLDYRAPAGLRKTWDDAQEQQEQAAEPSARQGALHDGGPVTLPNGVSSTETERPVDAPRSVGYTGRFWEGGQTARTRSRDTEARLEGGRQHELVPACPGSRKKRKLEEEEETVDETRFTLSTRMSRRSLAASAKTIKGRWGKRLSLIALVVAVPVGIASVGIASASSTPTVKPSSTKASAAKASAGLLCFVSSVDVGQIPDFTASYQAIAKTFGLQYKELIANPQGSLASGISDLKTCIADKPKIIVSSTQTNASIQPEINAAKKAGIYFISDYDGPATPGVDGLIMPDNHKMNQQVISWLKTHLGGQKPDILALTASPLYIPTTRIQDFVSQVKPLGWKVTVKQMNISNPSGSSETIVSAALLSDPKLSVIVTPWDDPAAGASAALRLAKNTKVKLVAYEGVPATYAAIRAGSSRIAVLNATPTAVQVYLRTIMVGEMVKGTFKSPYYAYDWGYNVTSADLPPASAMANPLTRIVTGYANVNGKVYTAAQLKAIAAKLSSSG
jgi:ABC-type sugar transport system substrate-binding protein